VKYIAQPKFWKDYSKLTAGQKRLVEEAWRIFKTDPFDPRLRTHRANTLSSIFRRPVHAFLVEADLRVIFEIDSDSVDIVNIGTHDIYKK
jgi:mRNA-degrading endonuclease YafQ of YafQ-DinJ toxin-antitoxin module